MANQVKHKKVSSTYYFKIIGSNGVNSVIITQEDDQINPDDMIPKFQVKNVTSLIYILVIDLQSEG